MKILLAYHSFRAIFLRRGVTLLRRNNPRGQGSTIEAAKLRGGSNRRLGGRRRGGEERGEEALLLGGLGGLGGGEQVGNGIGEYILRSGERERGRGRRGRSVITSLRRFGGGGGEEGERGGDAGA